MQAGDEVVLGLVVNWVAGERQLKNGHDHKGCAKERRRPRGLYRSVAYTGTVGEWVRSVHTHSIQGDFLFRTISFLSKASQTDDGRGKKLIYVKDKRSAQHIERHFAL